MTPGWGNLMRRGIRTPCAVASATLSGRTHKWKVWLVEMGAWLQSRPLPFSCSKSSISTPPNMKRERWLARNRRKGQVRKALAQRLGSFGHGLKRCAVRRPTGRKEKFSDRFQKISVLAYLHDGSKRGTGLDLFLVRTVSVF